MQLGGKPAGFLAWLKSRLDMHASMQGTALWLITLTDWRQLQVFSANLHEKLVFSWKGLKWKSKSGLRKQHVVHSTNHSLSVVYRYKRDYPPRLTIMRLVLPAILRGRLEVPQSGDSWKTVRVKAIWQWENLRRKHAKTFGKEPATRIVAFLPLSIRNIMAGGVANSQKWHVSRLLATCTPNVSRSPKTKLKKGLR